MVFQGKCHPIGDIIVRVYFLHDLWRKLVPSLPEVSILAQRVLEVTFLFLRYVNQGGNTALQDNESRLKELKERAEKLKMNKEAVSNEIDKMKNDISKQQVSLYYIDYILC